MKNLHFVLLALSLFFLAGCTPTNVNNPASTSVTTPVPSETTKQTGSSTTNTQSTTTTQIGEYTLAQVNQHAKVSDCWMAIDGAVYDVTSYIPQHPDRQIAQGCGKDATDLFASERKHQGQQAQQLLPQFKIGELKT